MPFYMAKVLPLGDPLMEPHMQAGCDLTTFTCFFPVPTSLPFSRWHLATSIRNHPLLEICLFFRILIKSAQPLHIGFLSMVHNTRRVMCHFIESPVFNEMKISRTTSFATRPGAPIQADASRSLWTTGVRRGYGCQNTLSAKVQCKFYSFYCKICTAEYSK